MLCSVNLYIIEARAWLHIDLLIYTAFIRFSLNWLQKNQSTTVSSRYFSLIRLRPTSAMHSVAISAFVITHAIVNFDSRKGEKSSRPEKCNVTYSYMSTVCDFCLYITDLPRSERITVVKYLTYTLNFSIKSTSNYYMIYDYWTRGKWDLPPQKVTWKEYDNVDNIRDNSDEWS